MPSARPWWIMPENLLCRNSQEVTLLCPKLKLQGFKDRCTKEKRGNISKSSCLILKIGNSANYSLKLKRQHDDDPDKKQEWLCCADPDVAKVTNPDK